MSLYEAFHWFARHLSSLSHRCVNILLMKLIREYEGRISDLRTPDFGYNDAHLYCWRCAGSFHCYFPTKLTLLHIIPRFCLEAGVQCLKGKSGMMLDMYWEPVWSDSRTKVELIESSLDALLKITLRWWCTSWLRNLCGGCRGPAAIDVSRWSLMVRIRESVVGSCCRAYPRNSWCASLSWSRSSRVVHVELQADEISYTMFFRCASLGWIVPYQNVQKVWWWSFDSSKKH